MPTPKSTAAIKASGFWFYAFFNLGKGFSIFPLGLGRFFGAFNLDNSASNVRFTNQILSTIFFNLFPFPII